MDLSQAEAVADVIASTTAASHQVAMSQMRGDFSKQLGALREQLVHLTSLLELELDFSDHEDLEFADRSALDAIAAQIESVTQRLADSFATGNVLKNGLPVAIVGSTNSGKSTLLNALLHDDRAIVSDVHGTTRDIIEDTFTLGGTLFRFIDTAGLRSTEDVVEQMGIARSRQKLEEAKIVLFVVDASGSMAARHRMEATKAAILSLLRDSYIHRDSVGLIAFRKESAEVLLPFTRSVERAERLLASMPTGGKTPLADGLRMAYTMCDKLLRAHRAERIQIICITDGRATSGASEDPVGEAKQWARILGTLPVYCIVIDTETGFIKLGLAKELCKLMNGSYYAMDTITADRILRVSRR